jgi:class 3 adenylate cyclase
VLVWAGALVLPVAGFLVLLAAPDLDVQWEHHPSHFWIVFAAGLTGGILAYATGDAARRRGDARVFLVSLAFLASAGFLGLHALATPGVLLDGPNGGFAIATSIGLLAASIYAAFSAVGLDSRRAALVNSRARLLRGMLLALMALWAIASLAAIPPLDDATPVERASGALIGPSVIAMALFVLAVVGYLRDYVRRGAALLLHIAVAFALLAEAAFAVAFARNWHATWWEWHLLMLAAFVLVAWSARREWRDERFSALYLDETAAGTREISVLFADLAGFTSFSDARDPREVSEMLNAYFEATVPPIVREHGGDIDRLIGDAIMATFNTRGDQPDHALHAARAALAIQEAAARIAEEHPDWPRFRAGVNSGEAMVGVVGAAGGRSYTVIGDTVNVASRIEAKAPVGGVALSAATLSRLNGATVDPIGAVELKGKSEPVEVYVLRALA